MGQRPNRKDTQPGLGEIVTVTIDGRPTGLRPRDRGEAGNAKDAGPTERITKQTETKWFTPPPEGSFRNPSNEPPPWTSRPTTKLENARKPKPKAEAAAEGGDAGSSAPQVTPNASKKKSRVSIRIDDVGDGGEGVTIVADGSGVGPKMVPRVVRSKQELAAAPIDHREGFVLALIDGQTTVQGVIDVSGMDGVEVTGILQRLRRLGIIAIR